MKLVYDVKGEFMCSRSGAIKDVELEELHRDAKLISKSKSVPLSEVTLRFVEE